MTAPKTPAAFDAIVADVAALLNHGTYRCDRIVTRTCPGHEEGEIDCKGRRVPFCISCTYRWAYNAAHDRTKLDPQRGPKGSISNPTAAIATEVRPDEAHGTDPNGQPERSGAKAKLRKALSNAGTDLQQLQGLGDRLTRALESSDVGHTIDPADAKRGGHEKTQEGHDTDMAELRAAKQRREDRGEGWGIG